MREASFHESLIADGVHYAYHSSTSDPRPARICMERSGQLVTIRADLPVVGELSHSFSVMEHFASAIDAFCKQVRDVTRGAEKFKSLRASFDETGE